MCVSDDSTDGTVLDSNLGIGKRFFLHPDQL